MGIMHLPWSNGGHERVLWTLLVLLTHQVESTHLGSLLTECLEVVVDVLERGEVLYERGREALRTLCEMHSTLNTFVVELP